MLTATLQFTSRCTLHKRIVFSHLNRSLFTPPTTTMSSEPKKVKSHTSTSSQSSDRSGDVRRTDGGYRSLNTSSYNYSRSWRENRTTWKEEKSKLEEMGQAERRGQYSCGDKFVEYNEHNMPLPSEPGAEDRICVWQGDITRLELDAIVNAANSDLRGGAGVDGAIHDGAGYCLKQETRARYPDGCETGSAVITSGYRLPAKHVIHTVGPMFRSREKLEKCYESVLALVQEHKIQTVAFPCISTGIYGYPNDEAAMVALTTTKDWLVKHPTFKGRIVFCVYLDLDLVIYNGLVEQIFSIKPSPSKGSPTKQTADEEIPSDFSDWEPYGEHLDTSVEKSGTSPHSVARHDDREFKSSHHEQMDSTEDSRQSRHRSGPDGEERRHRSGPDGEERQHGSVPDGKGRRPDRH